MGILKRSGEVTCSHCGGQIPRGAKYCPHCGSAVRGGFDGFRWRRTPEDVATRIELDQVAVQGLLSRAKKVQIDAGTRALILQEGRFIGELGPGIHTLDSLGQKIKQLRGERPTTVIVCDEGDISLTIEAGPLWSQDHIQVFTKTDLVVRIEDPVLFNVNFLKGRRHLTAHELAEQLLSAGVEEILLHKISQYKAEALYGNLSVRAEIEQDLKYRLEDTLSRNGLRLIDLRGFACRDTLEDLRRLREAVTKEERGLGLLMKRLQVADDLDAFQAEIEKSKILRESEKQELLDTIREKREDKQLARRLVMEKLEAQHRLELEQLRHDREIQQDRADLELGLEALRRLKEIKQGERDREAEREIRLAQEFSKVTDEALLAIKGDSEGLRRLAELKAKTGMTEEQILAAAVERNPEVARAFAEKFRAQGTEKRVEEQKEFRKEMKELLMTALEQMGRVAETRAESKPDNVFITPGSGSGGGDKTVIVQGGGSLESGRQRRERACPSCGQLLEPGSKFCTQCGGRLD